MNTPVSHRSSELGSAAGLGGEPPPSQWRDIALFFRNWLRTPSSTGAMVPSTRAMARRMTTVMDGHALPSVVELGPGTGPVTAVIQQRLRGRSTHVAVEVNAELAERLRSLYPQVDVVNESAASLSQILRKRELDTVDVVISGLPFTVFSPSLQGTILQAVADSLPADGVFATYRYLGAGFFPAAKRFQEQLNEYFTEVSVSGPIMGNVPPVCLITARGPRHS